MARKYTPSGAVNRGALTNGGTGGTWDGRQLVILQARVLRTLQRNANRNYTPSNSVLQGTLGILGNGAAIAWDGRQLVILTQATGRRLYTLARNANGSYTPSVPSLQGQFSSSLSDPRGMTWDGQQLVIVNTIGQLFTLPRNIDGSYSIGNLSLQGLFPSALRSVTGATWDESGLVTFNRASKHVFVLDRDNDGGYTPGNAESQGALPSQLSSPNGIGWDGVQLAIIDSSGQSLWTLTPDFFTGKLNNMQARAGKHNDMDVAAAKFNGVALLGDTPMSVDPTTLTLVAATSGANVGVGGQHRDPRAFGLVTPREFTINGQRYGIRGWFTNANRMELNFDSDGQDQAFRAAGLTVDPGLGTTFNSGGMVFGGGILTITPPPLRYASGSTYTITITP